MERPLVSVILPVYNVEKYLDKCLETVTTQTYTNLEIILINDGSTDASPKICKRWKERDRRIILVNKKNAGLGMARNTGLEYSSGKYVMFIDSDDFISSDMVEKLLAGANGGDTVFCGHTLYYSEDNQVSKPIKYDGKSFSGNDVQWKVLTEMMGALPDDPDDVVLPVSVWHGLYSMQIIKQYNVLFPSERQFISEDMVFDIDYFSHSQKVSFISDCLYYYRKNNQNSLTTIYNPERFNKEIILYNELDKKLKDLMPREQYIWRLQRTFLGRVRSCIVRATRQCQDSKREIYNICNNQTVQEVLTEYPYHKCSVQLSLFNFCIQHRLIFFLHLMIKLRYR